MSLNALCSYPGCTRKIAAGQSRCSEHRVKTSQKPSGSRASIYSSTRWKKLRLVILVRDPVCKICNKKPSKVVDHVVSIERGGDMWDPANLRGACWSCHSTKTNKEDGGFGNSKRAAVFNGVGDTVGALRLKD